MKPGFGGQAFDRVYGVRWCGFGRRAPESARLSRPPHGPPPL